MSKDRKDRSMSAAGRCFSSTTSQCDWKTMKPSSHGLSICRYSNPRRPEPTDKKGPLYARGLQCDLIQRQTNAGSAFPEASCHSGRQRASNGAVYL